MAKTAVAKRRCRQGKVRHAISPLRSQVAIALFTTNEKENSAADAVQAGGAPVAVNAPREAYAGGAAGVSRPSAPPVPSVHANASQTHAT